MPVTTTRLPIVSKISDELFARLQALVSGASGPYSFRNVVRPTKLATYTPVHGLIVLTRGDVSRVPDLDCPGNPPSMAWRQTFLIRVHIAPSERDATPIELYEDVMEAEIHNAVRTDSDWHTFGDNAIDAEFEPVQTVVSDGGYDGISITVAVTYRMAEGDPYTVRA